MSCKIASTFSRRLTLIVYETTPLVGVANELWNGNLKNVRCNFIVTIGMDLETIMGSSALLYFTNRRQNLSIIIWASARAFSQLISAWSTRLRSPLTVFNNIYAHSLRLALAMATSAPGVSQSFLKLLNVPLRFGRILLTILNTLLDVSHTQGKGTGNVAELP